MTTSKQEPKDKISEPVKNFMQKIFVKLDERPSRTATIMAIILVLTFGFSVFRFVHSLNNPVTVTETNSSRRLIEQINEGFTDSVGISEKFNNYFKLIEIQKELEEMQRDSSKIDSIRIEQLLEILNMK